MSAQPPPPEPYRAGGPAPTDPYRPSSPVGPATPVAPPAQADSPYASTPPPAPYGGGPYGGPSGGYPAPGVPSPGTDGVSIAALVTGILLLGPVALVLGIVGVGRTSRTGRSGQGLAIAGIVLGALSTLGWALLLGGLAAVFTSDDFREGFTEGQGSARGATSCVLLPQDLDADVSLPEPVECDTAHDGEVFANVSVPGDAYPGEDAVIEHADAICLDEFATYVGAPYATSSLDFVYWYPTPASWRFGDRDVMCVVIQVDLTQWTGTLQGSGL